MLESTIFSPSSVPEEGKLDKIRSKEEIEPLIPAWNVEQKKTRNEFPSESSEETADSCNNSNEDDKNIDTQELLKHRQRHVFILSENGKPIYTRFGDEDHLITMMGVIQAIVSLAETTESNELNFIKAGRSRISFLHRDPLTFVLVTYNDEPSCLLTQQLFYVYHQLISILTKTRIHHMYKNRPSFDLRRWLSSTEKQMFNNILDVYENDLGLLFESVQVLPLQMTTRSLLDLIIVEKVRQNNVRFNQNIAVALIIAGNYLVSLTRLRTVSMAAIDFHLLMNWVRNSDTSQGSEQWLPICLPIFDSSGTFHSHISSLDDSGIVKLVLLSISAGDFSSVSNLRQEIKKKCEESKIINKIVAALTDECLNHSEVLENDLNFFIYKSLNHFQHVSSKFSSIYDTEKSRSRIFERIRFLYAKLHDRRYSLNYAFFRTESEIVFGWLKEKDFEIFVVLSALITVDEIFKRVRQIVTYIKRKDDQLFISKCEFIA